MESGKHGVNLGSSHFGRTPLEFDFSDFDKWASENSEDRVEFGGLYMPCVFEKNRFIEAGMFPCGNVYHNGIGTKEFKGKFIKAGDDFFFHDVLEKNFDMRHITVFDSPVYHIVEGEKDS